MNCHIAPDTRGKAEGWLNYPYGGLLVDGKWIAADIYNGRVLIGDSKHNRMATQCDAMGSNGKFRHNPPYQLGCPNDVTALENGDILVTEIRFMDGTHHPRRERVVARAGTE